MWLRIKIKNTNFMEFQIAGAKQTVMNEKTSKYIGAHMVKHSDNFSFFVYLTP